LPTLDSVYADLKAAFDSMDLTALWLLLHSLGIPPKLVELMKTLYTGTVLQLFCSPMDLILARTIN